MIKIENLPVKLIKLMHINKISNVKLSEETGIPEVTIIKLKKGRNLNPTLTTLTTLANYFGITINDLLTDNVLEALDIDDTNLVAENVPIVENYFEEINFAIKIKNNNYAEFKKDSILLVKSNYGKLTNGDIVVFKKNNQFLLCKTIEINGNFLARSLIDQDQYYEINNQNVLSGIVVGVIWKRN